MFYLIKIIKLLTLSVYSSLIEWLMDPSIWHDYSLQ